MFSDNPYELHNSEIENTPLSHTSSMVIDGASIAGPSNKSVAVGDLTAESEPAEKYLYVH